MSNVQRLCHCGAVARNDGSDYEGVCSQWPLCESKPHQPEGCACKDPENHPGGDACTCDDFTTCDACIDAGIFDGIFDEEFIEPSREPDAFIIVEGGLVQNDPGLPVLDLDVLDTEFENQETVEEVEDLLRRATEVGATYVVERATSWLDGRVNSRSRSTTPDPLDTDPETP